ncbi:MAG TPA: rhamnogalacturonan acetylesterase [Edaphobacter sp.]|jgi:lysophospholipase L1-like esterase|nr:rhamnogalacturonan acetylesterase [Edaphobacter sp.]
MRDRKKLSLSFSLRPAFAVVACAVSLAATTIQQMPAPAGPVGLSVDPHADEQRLGLTGPANPKLPTLFLVGDSTVRNGHGVGSDGLWGWGAPIVDLFDPAKINVVNRAIGGLSSHTYISAGHWDSTLELIKPGDFVLIQFGHNDGGLNLPGAVPVPDQGLPPGWLPPPPASGVPQRPNSRESLPGTGEETMEVENPRTHEKEMVHTFGWYLQKYVADTRAKGATPILCSLVPRKIWVDGHIVRNTSTYRGWTKEVATKEKVDFVDLNEIIARRYDAMGEEAVDPLFGDPHTHTTLAGAQLNAECVVAGLKALPRDPLAKYFSAKGKAISAYADIN